MSRLKDVLPVLAFPLLLGMLQWANGNARFAYITFALIPLFFVGCGISWLLAGRKRREIARNLTDNERNTVKEMSRSFGLKLGIYFASPLGFISALTYYIFDGSLVASGISFVAGAIIGLPFVYSQSRPMWDYYFETEYAKKTFQRPE